MHTAWLANEHHRIHLIEQWPDGPRKQAALAAARSALESLENTDPDASTFLCAISATRRNHLTILDSPKLMPLPRDYVLAA